MDVSEVFNRLGEAGVPVWLDEAGHVRIDSDAPAELKQIVRDCKAEVAAVIKANAVMNRSGMRIKKLPLGGFALAKPPGPLPDEVVQAIKVLRMDSMPVVINDEGLRPMKYDEWLLRQPVCDPEDLDRWLKERESKEETRLRQRKRSA